MPVRLALQNCVTEWSYTSGKVYADPFNEVELDVVFTDPDGEEQRVPAFWSGGSAWRVRYSSPKVGTHQYRAICSDPANPDLNGNKGIVEVTPYEGDNPLFKHGPLRVSEDGRYLRHLDGAPFFWLADTWWMGLCKRLGWPGDFQVLTADRVAKGFTVIQIVAGLYPDMAPFDERGANEAGFPWETDYSRINPAYFDMADLRVNWLVASGLTPCIVGSWGWFLDFAGVEAMKKHWRNLIARYGAYPVVWCLAGEILMPYYLALTLRDWDSEERQQYHARMKAEWSEVARYLRSIDLYHRPATVHPSYPGGPRDMVDDEALIDLDMLHTGHYDRRSLSVTVEQVVESCARTSRKPVIDGEVCYEGIGEACRQEVQRLVFWACILSGACGHTYAANGVWQVNTRQAPIGPSPHGSAWGNIPWEDAYQLPGSAHLGVCKSLLMRYPWWQFQPHPEWADPHWTQEDYLLPYAAGVPRQVRLIFLPGFVTLSTVKRLEPGITYRAFYFDPKDGKEYPLGEAKGDANGDWTPPKPTIFQDWVLVLEG